MQPEETEARTRLEQEAGRASLRRFASQSRNSTAIKRPYPPDFVAAAGPADAKALTALPLDPDVRLPPDVQAMIARGQAAFERSKRKLYRYTKQRRTTDAPNGRAAALSFFTAVVDKEVQDRRDATLDALDQQSKGKRGQPPALGRLPYVQIIVDRLRAEGVPFATSRNSRMNRLVRQWLNERAASSRDTRKSRRKKLSPDAVHCLLKQIKRLDD
jgi:hypothetical protein